MESALSHGYRYPKSVKVDFNKLERHALMKLLKYYNVNPKVGATHPELASMVAKAFDTTLVSEIDVISKFTRNISYTGATDPAVKRPKYNRQYLDSEPARTGEQVAAKVSKSNENGSWILGNVLEYDVLNSVYIVQDEDDTSRSMRLRDTDVKRLDESAVHLKKGDKVLAVFPDTTSFYRCVVAKTPKATAAASNFTFEVAVRFEDDEDESGKVPARRVPARFILRRVDVEPDFVPSDGEE